MLPLRDDIPSRRFPIATLTLIVLNAVVFFYELQVGQRLDEFLLVWAIVPVRYTDPDIASRFTLVAQIVHSSVPCSCTAAGCT